MFPFPSRSASHSTLSPRALGPRTVRLVRAATKGLALRRAPDVQIVQVGGTSVRVHGRPIGRWAPPGTVWVHGGVGHDRMCSARRPVCGLRPRARGRRRSPRLRLAPEHPLPTPLDDCHRRSGRSLRSLTSIRPRCRRGDSAGSRLVAALALRARMDGAISIAFQLLTCPMLDDRTATRTDVDESSCAVERLGRWVGVGSSSASRSAHLRSPTGSARPLSGPQRAPASVDRVGPSISSTTVPCLCGWARLPASGVPRSRG